MIRRTVKSASRTFEVLELFAELRRPLRLHEVYTALGYPQSSTTNLLKSMVLSGYLNYNRRVRTYLPTQRVSALGSWLPGVIATDARYERLVDELQRRTDETVGIATQNDLFVQYAFLKPPAHEHKLLPPPGTLRLMVESASGLALMCRFSDREIDKICRYTNHYQLGGDRRIDLDDVMRQVRWFRHIGYAYCERAPLPEVSAISIALDETIHGIPLAVGVGGLHERISSHRVDILRTMRECLEEFKRASVPPHDEEEDEAA